MLNGFEDYDNFDEDLNSIYDTNTKPSLPIAIITLTNPSDNKLENIVVGSATKNLKQENYGFPPEVIVECKKTDGEKDIYFSYEEYLKSTIDNPFQINLTYLQSQMGAQSSVRVFINSGDFNIELCPNLDPYRQASNIQRFDKTYRVDGNEEIILSELFPKNKCTFYFYGRVSIPNSSQNLASQVIQPNNP